MTVNQVCSVHQHIKVIIIIVKFCKHLYVISGKIKIFFDVLHPDKTQNIPTKIKRGCGGKKECMEVMVSAPTVTGKIVPPSLLNLFPVLIGRPIHTKRGNPCSWKWSRDRNSHIELSRQYDKHYPVSSAFPQLPTLTPSSGCTKTKLPLL